MGGVGWRQQLGAEILLTLLLQLINLGGGSPTLDAGRAATIPRWHGLTLDSTRPVVIAVNCRF